MGARKERSSFLAPWLPQIGLDDMLLSEKGRRDLPLHLMLGPSVVLLFIYCYVPMLGLVISFQHFEPFKGMLGSRWVGLENYRYMVGLPGISRVLWNTVFIATMKIITGILVPVVAALLLNEIPGRRYQRVIQTALYFPYFLSWVIMGGILIDVLSPSTGVVNQLLSAVGIHPIYFLGNEKLFPYVLVVTDVWKGFGFSTVIYLAALTGIDPALYEACMVDGGKRWAQTIHVTLPGIASTVVLMATLSLGNILNAGFDQVFNLYSPQVYSTGDIIDTFVYRVGLIDQQYSTGTAVGLFKSLVSFALILSSYKLADRFANYRIF